MTITEKQPSGLEKVKQWLTWCGRCNSCKYIYKEYSSSCPAGERFQLETFWSSGKVWIAHGLLEGKLNWNEHLIKIIYACPLCGACSIQCQQDISEHLIDIFESLREEAVKQGYGPYQNQKVFHNSLIDNNNPYKEPHSNRLNWLIDKQLPDTAKILYFVGCTSSYREIEIAKSTVDLLKKVNADFTVSADEICCGSPIIRTGQTDIIGEIIDKNLKVFNKAGAEIIITSCAGCFRTLKKDYPRILQKELPFKILHITEFIYQMIKEGTLKISNPKPIKVTYHDPCHLGRHCGVFEEPREILKSIPNLELVEMPRNKLSSWCCGAGGGVKSGFKDWAVEISKERVIEAKKTGAEYLVTSCPFCLRNLRDANEHLGSPLKIVEIVDLINDLI